MAQMNGVVKILVGIGLVAAGLVGTVLSMILVLILLGIMEDSVVPSLGLGNNTINNISAVVTTGFSFITSLNSGLGILAALILIVIVVAIFGGLGFVAWKTFGKKGGNSGNY